MRVLIVDDHPVYRIGVRMLVRELDPAAEVRDVSNVTEAIALAGQGETFDLVLLDMHLPGPSGLDALQRVKEGFESAAVVVVSGDEDASLIFGAVNAGAAGYIPKTTDPNLTAQALRVVLAHGTYLPSSALRSGCDPAAALGPAESGLPELSDRQRAVLLRLLQGKANKVIARELGIAEGTVKAHLWVVYQALGVSSRAQAMCHVHSLGLLERLAP